MNSKLNNAIGFAMKAGRLKSGDYVTEKLLRAKNAKIALIDTTASDNTKDKYRDICKYSAIELIEVEELGRWIGKPGRMVAAVTDESFAQMIRRALEQNKTEPEQNKTESEEQR
ncbi:MAG: ribosomal L7Ae/L30e/S12e/Gadd45 family protein [Eubacteriales bacterium]|nr:ribosomal L7Ae/L30e/S12e/Gadd45 family protein [Eubacteriales bacterium]